VRPSTSPTRSRSRASPSTTRTPAVPAPAATRSTDRLRPTEGATSDGPGGSACRVIHGHADPGPSFVSGRSVPHGCGRRRHRTDGMVGPAATRCPAARGPARDEEPAQVDEALHLSSDRAFEQVIRACADPNRSGAWITEEIIALYLGLHSEGWAH